MSEPVTRPFGLLRHFTWASLVVILGGSLLAGTSAAWLMRGILVHMESEEAESIVEYFVTEFAQDGHTLDQWGVTPLTPRARARALADMRNFAVDELTLLALDGGTIEALLEAGSAPSTLWGSGIAEAAGGRVALRWEKDAFGEGASSGGVETYVPIREAGRVVAVAKLRRDLSPVMANALRIVPAFVIVAATVGLAIFGALWLLVRRADRLIGRQHAEIAHARADLEQRNHLLEEIRRKKDDFYAMCSHDLRSPLLSVHAALQLMLADARRPPAPEHRLFLEENARTVAALLDLVDNLLDLARADAPTNNLHPELLDVAELVKEVVATHRILPANGDVVIAESYPDRGAPLVADRHKLVRVIHNLIANAIKHGEGHPVDVAVETVPHGVRVTVRDHGAGISPNLIASIFDRYAGGSRGGLGLGLAIVKELVEAHGGSVHAASRPGEGAKLTVELPASPGSSAAVPARGIAPAVPV